MSTKSDFMQQMVAIKNANESIALVRKYIKAENDEARSNLLKQMLPEVQVMVKFMSPAEAIERLTLASRLDNFRPRDLSFEMFAMREDLQYVGGPFSTYNQELSKMWRERIDDDEIRFVIREEIQNNLRPVAINYGEQVVRLMTKHEKLARAAQASLHSKHPEVLGLFLHTLANDMKFEYGLYDCKLKVSVVDSWKRIPKHLWNSVDSDAFALIDFNGKKSWIYINRKTIFADRDKKYKFNSIVAALLHEFGHFIDWYQPNSGALGSQKAVLDSGIYDEKQYEFNATEESSAMIEKIVYNKLNENQRA